MSKTILLTVRDVRRKGICLGLLVGGRRGKGGKSKAGGGREGGKQDSQGGGNRESKGKHFATLRNILQ